MDAPQGRTTLRQPLFLAIMLPGQVTHLLSGGSHLQGVLSTLQVLFYLGYP
jgi:hypothetical protein